MNQQEKEIIKICLFLQDKTKMSFEYEFHENLEKFELICDNYFEYSHGTLFKKWRPIVEKMYPNTKFYVAYKNTSRKSHNSI